MYTVTFDPRWQAWRERARAALLAEQPPDELLWSPDEPDSQPLLPLGPSLDLAGASEQSRGSGVLATRTEAPGLNVPAEFVRLARLVAHHRQAGRWDLLYRLLWRLQHGEPSVLDDMLDPEVFRFRRMAAAVRDDLRETRARLSFWSPAVAHGVRRAGSKPPSDDRLPDMVSWCEPRHRVLALLAEDFAERYPERSFALISPDASAFWDTVRVELGPGMDRRAAQTPPEIARRWTERRPAAA